MLTYEEVEALKQGDRLAVRNWTTNFKWEPGTVTGKGTLSGVPSIWVKFDRINNHHSVNISTGTQWKKEFWGQGQSSESFKNTIITSDFIEYAEVEAAEVKEFAASLVGMDIREADKKLAALMKELLQTDLPRRNLYVNLARYLSSHGDWGLTIGEEAELTVSTNRTRKAVVKDIDDTGLVCIDNRHVSPSLVAPIRQSEAIDTEQLSLF